MTKKQTMDAFKALRDEIVELAKDPMEKQASDDVDLISCLESKMEDKSFAEVVTEKSIILKKLQRISAFSAHLVIACVACVM